VTAKLEEALRLARQLEETPERETCGAGMHA
jgi:hypothetical protein